MMPVLDNKHIHALAAWVILAAILFSVGLPVLSLLGGAFEGQGRLSDKQDVIASLEQRVRALQTPVDDKMFYAITVESDQGTAAQTVLASCNALIDRHAKYHNMITLPCQRVQTQLDDQFTVYTAEVSASGSIENLMAALDDAQLGHDRLAEFYLSTDENTGGGILRLKFASIGVAAEAPAQ